MCCNHSSESYCALRSCGSVYYAVQAGFNFWVCGEIYGVTIQMKATEQYFPVVVLIMLCKVVLTFESVDEILKCYHWTIFSHEIFAEVWFGLELRKFILFIHHPPKPANATLSPCSLALGTFLSREASLVMRIKERQLYWQTINLFVCLFCFL